MSKPAWKKLRVVVEMSARGQVSEKDLAWAVKLAIDNTLLMRRLHVKMGATAFGRLEVKEFGRILTAALKDGRSRGSNDAGAISKTLANVEDRLRKLERMAVSRCVTDRPTP